MKKAISLFYVLLFISFASNVWSSDTLALTTYLDVISKNHPLIKKANLFDQFSEAALLKGKGALDPKVTSDYQTKNFSDTNYFRIWQTEAKIPTRLPIDLSLGYERNNGDFLNPENSVTDNGLVYGTFSLSVIRGLLFDEQRFNIQIADLKSVKSQIEKNILTREIIYQAVNNYLDWSIAYYKNEILTNYLEAITARHTNIIQLYVNGDKPAIDTIESQLSLNSAKIKLLESNQELIQKTQKLALFLWDENGNHLELAADIKPELIQNIIIQMNEMSLAINPDFNRDPIIRKKQNQIEQYRLENKLQRENLKPRLDLKYNGIVDLGKDELSPTYSVNDYKYGLSFEMPVLNRKTKGELRMNDVLIAQNEFDQINYRQQLLTKYEALLMNKIINQESLEVALDKIENSTVLRDAENTKFSFGESSFFMVNQRERKLLEANTELIKSYKELGKTLSELYYLKLGQE